MYISYTYIVGLRCTCTSYTGMLRGRVYTRWCAHTYAAAYDVLCRYSTMYTYSLVNWYSTYVHARGRAFSRTHMCAVCAHAHISLIIISHTCSHMLTHCREEIFEDSKRARPKIWYMIAPDLSWSLPPTGLYLTFMVWSCVQFFSSFQPLPVFRSRSHAPSV